jgi:hypothetical protein
VETTVEDAGECLRGKNMRDLLGGNGAGQAVSGADPLPPSRSVIRLPFRFRLPAAARCQAAASSPEDCGGGFCPTAYELTNVLALGGIDANVVRLPLEKDPEGVL